MWTMVGRVLDIGMWVGVVVAMLCMLILVIGMIVGRDEPAK